MAKKKMLVISLSIVIILCIVSFISYSKFNVINPLSTASGLIQIVFTDKKYVEIQKYPKVIVAKPDTSLKDYMEELGFEEDTDSQMGALFRFKNKDSAQYIMYSVNKYFSKWNWQE